MKSLKFTPSLAAMILAGEKTSTWRLFDDKDLQQGDTLIFVNKETGESFGAATVTSLNVRTLGKLTEDDWIGHEKFVSEEEMYKTYRGYYGDRVGPGTEVKILTFDFQPL